MRELSRLDPDPKVWMGSGGRDNPGRALLGLIVMVCDSARMNPVLQAIAGGWNNGTKFTKELMDYIKNWPVISRTTLLDWRDHAYHGWPQNRTLESIGIMSPEDALKLVPLVFNDPDRICPPYYDFAKLYILFVVSLLICCHKIMSIGHWFNFFGLEPMTYCLA